MENAYVDAMCRTVRAYLDEAKSTGKTVATQRNYTRRLRSFMDYYAGTEPTAPPTAETVRGWRSALQERGCSPATVRQYLIELKYFFAWAADPDNETEQAGMRNPVGRKMFPKVEKRPYDLLIPDHLIPRLWKNTPPPNGHRALWPRNYAIVALLLTTKMRNAELLSLRPCDLHWDEGYICIESGKGNKYRETDFNEFAQSAVNLYLLSGVRPSHLPDTAPLFGTTAANEFQGAKSGGEWHRGSAEWLSNLVERHVRLICGIPNIRTHDLRHVGARLALNAGASMEAIQAELGHACMSTTQIYSGRLMQRRGRTSAASVLSRMDTAAAENRAEAERITAQQNRGADMPGRTEQSA